MSEFYEAHKTIWLQVDPDGEVPVNIEYPICEGATWCQDQINGTDVEYIRADLVATLKQQRDELLALVPQRTAGGFVAFGKYYAEQERVFAPPHDPMAKFKHKYLDQCEAAIEKVKE